MATTLLLIIGICYYNIITMENQKVINQKIDITKNKIKLFQKNNDSSSDLINQYNKYMKSIPTLASYYENDNEVLSSLNKIRDICNKYNVELDELNPKLNNTLDVSRQFSVTEPDDNDFEIKTPTNLDYQVSHDLKGNLSETTLNICSGSIPDIPSNKILIFKGKTALF